MDKLVSSNEVFDYICDLRPGSIVLILDETRFESMLFLNSLFSTSKSDVLILSTQQVESSFKLKKMELDKFADVNSLSHTIEELREKLTSCSVIVHDYLPHLLVQQNEALILQMVEFWLGRAEEKGTIEFITLPEGTFPSFEKKLQALAHGTVYIKLNREDRTLSFSITKACKPEYHLKEFPFIIREGRLLVRWGQEYTDRLPREGVIELSNRVRYLKENLNSLKIVTGDVEPKGLDPYEYWFLSQAIGKRLMDIHFLFPDRFEQSMELLARLSLRNLVSFATADDKKLILMPSRQESITLEHVQPDLPAKKSLSWKSKLALTVPLSISLLLLQKSGHYITSDTYYAYKKCVESYFTYTFGQEDFMKKLHDFESFFQEMTARSVSLERIIRNKEDPRIRFDVKYLPRCVALTVYAAFHRKPKVSEDGTGSYRIVISDCPVCAHQKSEEPMCKQVSATIIGMCAICFKEPFQCDEISCIAAGASSCIFQLRRQ